jgi:NADH-quinone oxidoreductase subunit A
MITLLHSFIVCLVVLMGIQSGDEEKNSSYECGFPAFVTKDEPLEISFFATAISFLVFDIELVVLLPWVSNPNWTPDVAIFMILLIGTLAFEIFEGTLEWVNDVE